MEDRIITTLPIKPQEHIKIGLCLAPLLTELLKDTTSSKNAFAINLLNTYDFKDDVLNNYLSKIGDMNITFDELYIDKENVDSLIECINELIYKGIIIEKKSDIYRCDCGRVDTPKECLRTYDSKALYYKDGKNYYCKICHSKIHCSHEKNLFLHLDDTVNTSLKIFPEYLSNSFKNFDKQYKGMDYLISKARKTVYQVTYNNSTYNIDIDALWMNFINCFQSNTEVIVASNHQLFEMYLINYINKMFKNKDLHFVATPYLVSKNKKINIDDNFEKMRLLEAKLSLLFSLKWKRPDSTYNETAIAYLNKMSDDELEDMYEIVRRKSENEDIDVAIKNTLLDNINFQKVLKRGGRK